MLNVEGSVVGIPVPVQVSASRSAGALHDGKDDQGWCFNELETDRQVQGYRDSQQACA